MEERDAPWLGSAAAAVVGAVRWWQRLLELLLLWALLSGDDALVGAAVHGKEADEEDGCSSILDRGLREEIGQSCWWCCCAPGRRWEGVACCPRPDGRGCCTRQGRRGKLGYCGGLPWPGSVGWRLPLGLGTMGAAMG